MTSMFRPVAVLLLAAGTTSAHAADTFSTDTAVAAFSVIDARAGQAAAGADGSAAQQTSHSDRDDRPAVLATLDFLRAGDWTAGAGDARADGRLLDDGAAGVRRHVGYRHALGPFDVDATLSYTSYPGMRPTFPGAPAAAGYGVGEWSAGLRYGPLSARYSSTLTGDASGLPGGRGGSYLDLGLRHDLGHAISLMLHAGDGRVPGGSWDWRDLRAGLNRKLEGGWLLALNYTRAYGAIASNDRFALATGRADPRPAFLSAGRRALVLSATRRF